MMKPLNKEAAAIKNGAELVFKDGFYYSWQSSTFCVFQLLSYPSFLRGISCLLENIATKDDLWKYLFYGSTADFHNCALLHLIDSETFS